jgi:hypothetical protein
MLLQGASPWQSCYRYVVPFMSECRAVHAAPVALLHGTYCERIAQTPLAYKSLDTIASCLANQSHMVLATTHVTLLGAA